MSRCRLAIVGASALGRQLKGHAEASGSYDVVGFFDDFALPAADILGKTNAIEHAYNARMFDCLAIGVGYKVMSFRDEIAVKFAGRIPLARIVHRSAIVDDTAEVGEGAVLLANSVVDQHVVLGDNCFISISAIISHNSKIGSSTYVSPKVTVCGNCRIGKRVFLGAGCIIRDGIEICDDAIIGAGAVVVKHITSAGVYAGHPAKLFKKGVL